MKRSLALFVASFLAVPMLFSEENGAANPAPSQTEKLDLPPTTQAAPSTNAPAIPLTPSAPPTLPAEPAAAPDPGHKPKKPVGPSRTDAAEDAMQLHIRLRAAKTKALEDPAVQAEFAKIELMKTDYDRREASKRYYVLLYARMIQIDPSITLGLVGREAVSLIRNYQTRIIPTVPQDQIGQAKPIGPETAITGTGSGGTPIPRRSFGQARIGSF